ncbi:MAG: alpha/beta fold hydrolase [Candidatus Dormibacteria bacterium]
MTQGDGGLMQGIEVEVNGLKFNVVDAGSGPGVLLLHGFPDSSHLWRNQVQVLVDAGFRVVAPDLRGFGRSDRPEGVEAYRMGEMLADVHDILRTLGVPRVFVVGHDWGAALAWMFTITQPQKVDRLVAISVGHPAKFFRPSLRQMQMSWYTLLFQFPGIAEALFPRDNWSFLKGWSGGTGDLDRYQQDLARPGALTAGLNWYRANLNPQRLVDPEPEFPLIEVPVMGIWGAHDAALAEETMTGSSEYVSGPWRYERFEDAGHWIPLEQPERLNHLLLEFFAHEARPPRDQPDVRAAVSRRTVHVLADRIRESASETE